MNRSKIPAIQLLLAYAATYVIWGTSYLAIIYALKGFGPFTISALRYLIAGGLLCGWIIFKKLSWPDRGELKVLIISGILMLSGGSGLVVMGEQYINSGSAAVIMATEPLFFILLDRKHWQDYFSNKWILIGLLIGFAGIVLFSFSATNGAVIKPGRTWLGIFITLLSAVSWVTGALYAKRKIPGQEKTVTNSTVQLLAAGVFSGLIAVTSGELTTLHIYHTPASAWNGLLYLVIFASLIAYLSFNWLIKVQPPAIVSTHTYVNPIIAVLIGWLVASEQISGKQLLSLAVVLIGVMVTQLSKQRVISGN